MGLTKQYLTYKLIGAFNIITSERTNVAFVTFNKISGRYVAVGAAKNVFIWDLKLSEKVQKLCDGKNEVTALRPSPDKIHMAIGYANGTIDIFNITTGVSTVCALAVHRNAITILRYDNIGMKLVSGGLDTDAVVIDVIAQAGKCRLSGHTGPITDVCFYEPCENILITASKDTQIKLWNIETQCCFKILIDHSTEIWNLSLLRDCDFLIAGSRDHNINVYKLTPIINATDHLQPDDIECTNFLNCHITGQITRVSKGRTVNLTTDPTGKIMACHGTDNIIEIFYFYQTDEALKRLNKRLKKLTLNNSATTNSSAITLNDEIRRLPNIKVNQKIKSLDLLYIDNRNELQLVVTCANNSIELFSVDISLKKHNPSDAQQLLVKSIVQMGHRTAIRSLAFSLDGDFIASGSNDSLKIWNRSTMNCVKSVNEIGTTILCCQFTPSNRFAVLGLKTGDILIVDTVAGDIIERILSAHKKEIWSMCLRPDSTGFLSGSGDCTIKLWQFQMLDNKQISLLHKHTHELDETVLCIKMSTNHKFIAVGLLDSTVKILFADTFQFYLSLYGHKLPVLCLDISDDSAIIATGSADRNVKIWGVDFGDCHRSLFAHDDSVMAVQFIPKTHLFWTCGKDGKLKQWDGDTFNRIFIINDHIGEVYNLSIDFTGSHIISCGSDKVLRLYTRTDEILVLQDAQEDVRDQKTTTTIVPLLPNLNLPSKKTIGAENGVDSILECLDVIMEYEADNEQKTIPPIMMAFHVNNSIDYLLAIFERIRASDLEESLIILPFSSACHILERVPKLLTARKDQTELIMKITLCLFKIHHKVIVGTQTCLPILQDMLTVLVDSITNMRDIIGENKFALLMLQHEIEQTDGVELFKDATLAQKLKNKKHKQREAKKRLHTQMV